MLFVFKNQQGVLLSSIEDKVIQYLCFYMDTIIQLSSSSRDSSLLTSYRKSIPSPLGKADSDMKDMEEGFICFPL